MPVKTELKEDEDFYLEKGLVVFTEKYHLKRGYCCQNGCRNCPYKKGNPDAKQGTGHIKNG
ncbi:MAG: uncharacterized protein OJF59_000511 [Cytophagales bacterium]|jgi:hypothetical protein|nr:hypothetical protein [Bacteroidota bacterium]MBS1981426.1 hypothetical protein [Bacteroidota bacterium]WHZ06758.1 MAG: uncharacterized protein OJF59_000511 [Cytophagales bacterium]